MASAELGDQVLGGIDLQIRHNVGLLALFPEILGMSDRIYVMNEGRIVGEFVSSEASQEGIMSCILKSCNDNKGALSHD